MGFLFYLILTTLLFFSGISAAAGGGSTPGPLPVTPAPATSADQYELPAGHATTIDAVVNRGPLPPQYQAGYEITIDATGRAVVVETPQGASPALRSPTARQRTTTVEIGVTGVQRLLANLKRLGFFELSAQRQPLVGGPTSSISVTLAGGSWTVSLSRLAPGDADRLAAAQRLIARSVGFTPASAAGG